MGETLALPTAPVTQSRPSSEPIIPGKAGQSFHIEYYHDVPAIENMAASDLLCLHAYGGPWIDSRMADHITRTRLGTDGGRQPSQQESGVRSSPGLPPLRSALWLPLATQPPIVLAISEPAGKLLALEVSTILGSIP